MTDYIDRQAAIDAVCGAFRVMDFDDYANRYIVVETIRVLPSAQPKQQWIPVSERLPDDLEEVIVTWVNHNPEPYYAFLKDKSFTGAAVYYRGDWYWYSCICTDILTEYGTNGMDKVDDGVEITAWMPLPEPYKEESNEEEGEEA